MSILTKLVLGQTPTQEEIEEELAEVCEDTHAYCSDQCPVFELNGSKVPNKLRTKSRCDCFKNGKKMATFIKEHS